MKSIFIATLLLSVFLLTLPAAEACSCADPLPPRRELKKAKAVFVGEVIEINEMFIDDPYRDRVKFRVERYWKGIKKSEITILANLPGECGTLSFEAGKKYLVYAFGRKLVAYGCRRNKRLEVASQDLKELGEGKKFS